MHLPLEPELVGNQHNTCRWRANFSVFVSRSVRDVDEAAGELAPLQLVDESDGVVLGADVAVSLAVAAQLVIAYPVRAWFCW